MPTADLQPGRWRCTLCRQRLWRTGTPAEWFLHYYTTHYAKD